MSTLLETIMDIFEEKNVEKIDREELIENLTYAGDVIQENLEEIIKKDKTIKLPEEILYYVNADLWEENNKLYMEIEISREDSSTDNEDEAYQTIFTPKDPLEVCKITNEMKNADIIKRVQEQIEKFQEKFLNLIKAKK
jgi:hypothetical protein